MTGEWRETNLGDVIELKRGYDLPQQQRTPGRVPLVSSSGISDYHAVAAVKGPGVVTGRYGTLGEVFFIPEDFWPLNTTLYVRDFKGNDPRFISYFLRCLDFRSYSDKAAVPGLNRNHLHEAQVRIPSDVNEQRAIAHILGTLDDQIELNRRMNETLEAMARAIFKSWFVDFDPVRAKMEGQQPVGMDAETASLFPTAVARSLLGEVPSGWRTGRVSDFCTTQYGYTASASSEETGPKFLRITDMNKEPWIDWEGVPYCSIPEDLLPRYRLHLGDVLVSRMADPGKAAIVEEEVEAVFASYLIRLQTAEPAVSYYLFYFLRSGAYLDYAQGAMSGSVQANMNAKVITAAHILVPPTDVLGAFWKIVLPLRQRITSNLREAATLGRIRDTLLPKLISGVVRVPEAERLMAERAG